MKIRNDFMNPKDVEMIHEATINVLSKVGVEFKHEKALSIFAKHGARVEGDKVFISESLLQSALSSIPKSFVLLGRSSDKNVNISLGQTVFAPASGPIFIREGLERRFATCKDFENFTKLCESSTTIAVINANITEPQDLEYNKRNPFRIATSLKYTTKPLMGFTIGKSDAQDCIELVQKFVGSKEKNLIMGVISVISPLKYDSAMLEALFEYAKEDQPLLFACCSLPGATSPISIAGTLVVNNAEVLAGIVLSQLIKPGLSVIYGNTSPSCDMRYMNPAIGSPETGLITFATAALSKYYGIPCRSGGSLSDAQTPDIQAGIESTLTILPPIISGISFVLQSCGILESFNALSYEKFVIDEQLIETSKRFCRGFDITEDLIGFDTILNVGSGGHFLEEMHTMEHFRNEHYIPKLSSKESYDVWTMNGSQSMLEKARLEISKRVNQFELPCITKEQKNILSLYL
jgi:trimethylamine---corrinoid protein Co-methyltransferase